MKQHMLSCCKACHLFITYIHSMYSMYVFNVCMYVCVCMYVYVCMYVCMYCDHLGFCESTGVSFLCGCAI